MSIIYEVRRLLTFTQKSIKCENNLVGYVARYAVRYGHMASSLGCSIFQCCSRHDFEYENFMSFKSSVYSGLLYWSMISREDVEKARALLELLFIRSGAFHLNNCSQ